MGRTLTAREVAQILGVSPKTVREWANDGVLKGEKTDDGPGKETWEFFEDELYSSTDKRVVNRLRPEEVSERRNAQQRIEDLESEIEHLKASLKESEEALQSEREDREGILEKRDRLHEKKVAALQKTVDQYEDACFAVEDAMKASLEAISLKRDLDELFGGKSIKVRHRMADDLESWHLRYTIQGRKDSYEMQEFTYKPAGRLKGLNRYLLETEAGEFLGCHNPSKERLQARRLLYGFRLRLLAIPVVVLMLFLMALGRVTPGHAIGAIALGVVALVVVDWMYRIRIGIRRWREAGKR